MSVARIHPGPHATVAPARRFPAFARSFAAWRRTGLLDPEAVSADDLAAFGVQSERNARLALTWMTALLSGFNLAFWASDGWVFRHLPGVAEALARGRTYLLGVSVATALALLSKRTPTYPLAFASGSLVCVITASTLSDLGGPSTPWFHFLHTYTLTPALAWFPPLRRLMATLAIGALCLVGYFGPHPSYLADPYTATSVGHFLYVVAMSVAVGWFADALRIRYFLAQRALAAEREALAARVAEATDALRRLARHLDDVQDRERARVARELHDELGQSLTALRLVLKTARERYARDPAVVGPNLEQLTTVVQQLTDDTRRIVRDMRPRVLDDLGLAPALEWLRAGAEERGVPCTLTLCGDLASIPPAVSTAAFRCAQEALTNVLKHAEAGQARLTAEREGAAVTVTVEDDGVGFDVAAPRADRFGIVGMRERVRAFGGELTVGPRSPRGTVLVARLLVEGRAS